MALTHRAYQEHWVYLVRAAISAAGLDERIFVFTEAESYPVITTIVGCVSLGVFTDFSIDRVVPNSTDAAAAAKRLVDAVSKNTVTFSKPVAVKIHAGPTAVSGGGLMIEVVAYVDRHDPGITC